MSLGAGNTVSQRVAEGGGTHHVGCKQLELQTDVLHCCTVTDGVSRRMSAFAGVLGKISH